MSKISGILDTLLDHPLKRAYYRHCGGAKIVILGGSKMTLFGHFLVSFWTPFLTHFGPFYPVFAP